MQLSNYLFFTTNCEAALAFYAECGLGRIVDMLRYGENGMPAGSAAMRGKIMHAKFEGPGGVTNWELSAARANSARAVLASEGIDSDRIFQVSGKAGSDPLLPDDPYASANRRISILLMSEAPVVPPGHKL